MSHHSDPKAGYRYDGLYWIDRYLAEVGKHGFRIWRYRLEALGGRLPGVSGGEKASGANASVDGPATDGPAERRRAGLEKPAYLSGKWVTGALNQVKLRTSNGNHQGTTPALTRTGAYRCQSIATNHSVNTRKEVREFGNEYANMGTF